MRIGQVTINTDNMTLSEINRIADELREIRKRKEQAHTCKVRMANVVEESQEYSFRFVNRYTGQVFDVNDWFVYDEEQHFTHGEEVDK